MLTALEGGTFYIYPPSLAIPALRGSFLQYDEADFYRFLGVQELNEVSLFEQFSLPEFEHMSEGRKYEQLSYIEKNWAAISGATSLHGAFGGLLFPHDECLRLRNGRAAWA